MSRQESGSGTWPRFAAFSRDNLDVENAPEEGDVDHHEEQPSWRTGTAAVGTGAGPPDLDAESEDSRDDGQAYARENGLAENGDAPAVRAEPPGFDEPAPGFNDAAAPAFGGDPFGGNFGGQQDNGAGTPGPGGFGSQAEGNGAAFTDGRPTFGEGQSTFGEGQPFGNGQSTYDEPHPSTYDEPHPFGEGQQPSAFGDGFQGGGSGSRDSYEGAPGGDSYGGVAARDSFDGGSSEQVGFGAPGRDTYSNGVADRDGFGAPAAGAGLYGGQPGGAYGGNGAGPRDNGPYTGQFRPVPQPQPQPQGARERVTASLKAVRRPKQPKDAQAGRQAQLTLSRFEPWSVMKFSFVISVVAFIVLFVAVAVLWAALSGLGVFSTLQHTIQNITSSQSSTGFNLNTYLSASRVLGYTGLLGAINVVLITAICTVGSVLYNLAAGLVGGVEVTLKESD
jgi:Transmembrane domain of unknown function (DUF3566)